MDKIELVVTHQAGIPVGRHWSAVFGMAGGTVGRAGQNKLVLTDDDAMVARVHAMVRLDSDQAYIANLCERRAVQVNGLELLSGQEVPLAPGAEIGIGPYHLRAVIPGQKPSAAAPRTAPSNQSLDTGVGGTFAPIVASTTSTPLPFVAAKAATSSLDLASLPNPWADIPPIVGEDSSISALILTHQPEALPHSSVTTTPEDSNPFAMLGRAEATPATVQHIESTAQPMTAADADAPPVAGVKKQSLPNPFANASATSKQASVKPAAHRAMVIPADFDPFAADPKQLANQQDPWSGDLAAKSLSEVAPLKNDELLQALPRTGQFAGEMDNAAHTGLPQQLDPATELNPLKLFREPGESMYAEPEDHGISRGSDLAQVFSMPRDAQQSLASKNTPAATSPDMAPPSAPDRTEVAPVPPPPAESVVQAGLHAMQGLDLSLFGDGSTQASLSQELLSLAPLKEVEAENDLSGHIPLAAPSLSKIAAAQPCLASMAPAPDTPVPLDALAAAFLEGAAIEPSKATVAITPDFMRTFGEALRVAVQGSMDLLSARSEIKREFRADVTIIASGANNPLKFLPTADGVMLQLAGQTFPGFMKPVPAMKEAYTDLAVHQIALMAGIRAAYAEAAARLSPATLEKDASVASGVLARISSVHRKAALWDDFQQRYESVRRNAEDDLMAFSGQTFVDAYEAAAQAAEGSL